MRASVWAAETISPARCWAALTISLEKILPGVDKCLAPGGIVICESETGLVLPAEVGGMTLKKQYKYGKVLLWKYGKPRQSAGEGDAE